MSRVLVVCTGNICRSPIAEGFLRHLLTERGVDGVVVESAGVSGWEDSGAVPEAVEALHELGLDITAHRARRLSRAQIESADLVLALAGEHRAVIVRLCPSAAPRTFTLKEMIHLLRRGQPLPRDADPGRKVESAVAVAERLRASGIDRPADEDVADPLGLGLESFRATAWELETLCQQFVDLVFGEVTAGRRA
jgi:protein-tyrosine phosphatase